MGVVHTAGHPALDLVGTRSERGTGDVEELTVPSVLSRWWVEAGIVDDAPRVADEDLADALEVREAMHRILRAWTAGRPLAERDIARVRAARAPGPVEARLTREGTVRRRGSSSQCLASLVSSFLDLLHDEPRSHVRWCADDRCTHPFLDTSRSQRRRWCDMATCGARNKQRAFRTRHAQDGPASGR